MLDSLDGDDDDDDNDNYNATNGIFVPRKVHDVYIWFNPSPRYQRLLFLLRVLSI